VEIGVPVRVQTLAVMLPHAAGFESGHFFGLCHNDALYISVVVEGGSGPGLGTGGVGSGGSGTGPGGGWPGKGDGDGRGGSGGCSGGNGLGISGPMNFIFKTSNLLMGTGVPHV
jgi:hypothetical protein